MKITTRVIDKIESWHPSVSGVARPSHILLDSQLYAEMHQAAQIQGFESATDPEYEEQRLEFRGIKVYRSLTKGIQILP